MELIEQMWLRGFCTASEPLYVTQPDKLSHQGLALTEFIQSEPHPLSVASLGYIKGYGRCTTLLAMLHWMWQNGLILEDINPKLHLSCHTVYVYAWNMETRLDETMKNLSLSCAGSIRRPPNVVGIVSMIKNLMDNGEIANWMDFVRKWNPQSTRSFQIAGSKASSLKLMFELAPRPALTVKMYT